MYRIKSAPSTENASFTLGEFFESKYFPLTCFGRCRAYQQDIALLLKQVCAVLIEKNQTLTEYGTFETFTEVFRTLEMSKILTLTENESECDTYDILTGTVLNMLHQSDADPDLAACFMRVGRAAHLDWKAPAQSAILRQCYLVYLLYALSHAQYLSTSLYPATSLTPASPAKCPLRLNVNLEDVSLVAAIVSESQGLGIFPEVPFIVDELFFGKDRFARICLHHGPQYLYEDRYGNPLQPFSSTEAKEAACEPGSLTLRVPTITPAFQQRLAMVQALTARFSELIDPGSSTQSSQFYQGHFKHEVDHYLDVSQHYLHIIQEIEDAIQALGASKNDEPRNQLMQRVQSLVRLTQSRSKKRVRRIKESYTNPSGLLEATKIRSGRQRSQLQNATLRHLTEAEPTSPSEPERH